MEKWKAYFAELLGTDEEHKVKIQEENAEEEKN